MLRVAIVANEPSGDVLGAGLMRGLKRRHPDIHFEGVGGVKMQAEGLDSLYPLERLSIMGLVEVLQHLPDLLSIRNALKRRFLHHPPDLFIGIDAPDFNLGLEKYLRQRSIPTVHYICPSVWAWRPKRVKKIRAAADLVLCILPFEPEFLARHQVQGVFVGHTLAEEIPQKVDVSAARKRLGLNQSEPVLALLPGSRMSEVSVLSEPFLQTARLCRERFTGLQVVVPLVNPKIRDYFETHYAESFADLSMCLVDGYARDSLAAADVVLTASGTATLEALLLRKPMVVGYKLNPWTYRIVRWFNLVKVPFYSIANLLADRELVPEFIQDAVQPEPMAEKLCAWLESPEKADDIRQEAEKIHRLMSRQADDRAAEAVLKLVGLGDALIKPQEEK